MFATLPAALLETLLGRLAILFLSGAAGDHAAARHAASQMLAAYRPETADELQLAAQIVSFSFHALEALGQAADPSLPLNRIIRLRGSAVSLSRESAKAQRRLEQTRKARQEGAIQPETRPADQPPQPKTENALNLIQETRQVAAAAQAAGITWTQAHEDQEREKRIAAGLQRMQARLAAKLTAPAPAGLHPAPQAMAVGAHWP